MTSLTSGTCLSKRKMHKVAVLAVRAISCEPRFGSTTQHAVTLTDSNENEDKEEGGDKTQAKSSFDHELGCYAIFSAGVSGKLVSQVQRPFFNEGKIHWI